MFYATPDQKANTNIYARYYSDGVGPNQPSARQVQNSANREQANRNLMGGSVIAAATGSVLVVGAPIGSAIGAMGYSAIGAITGGGMDSAGQYAQSGSVRLGEAAFATATGAISGSVGANVKFFGNLIAGAATNAANTLFNNAYYGENSSLAYASALGSLGAAGGYFVGAGTSLGLSQLLKPYVYDSLNPALPALLQPRVPNPIPGLSGAMSGGIASGTSSFVPGKPAPK
ncbi:hypothetical protein [Paraburkholderia phenoliruptrix]|uniref:hypothetical protein n=1 Tax=Paraburkholderia phenoliruptrix TaxID=252970 RepID=UPI0028698915|nr:hypothetical protein [Paraburkholderia phenoliruptrix]WMY09815.1 hypothetical protein P3F88_08690 [Paraburkholderia phenoliruptrix]